MLSGFHHVSSVQVGKVAVVLDMSIVIWVCPNSTGWHQLNEEWRMWQTLGISLSRYDLARLSDDISLPIGSFRTKRAQKRSRLDFMDNPSMDD